MSLCLTKHRVIKAYGGVEVEIYAFLASVPNEASFFFGGEGPRSRSYGRTAALSLILQPCDEDD